MKMYDYEKEHLERLRGYLAECTVLLRSNGDFPLKEAGKVALYGSGARHTIKGGTGSGEVNSRFFTTVEQGLTDAGFEITTKSWLDAYDQVLVEAKKDFIREIKARAKQNHTMAVLEGMGAVMPEPEYELPLDGSGDVAVYVLSRISGEGNDRNPVGGDILLSKTETRDIQALQKKYDKFMLVLNVGGPVDLSSVPEAENILVLSQLGVETGAALADILLGKANPSGKLTTTWSAWEETCDLGEFGDINDTRYKEGIYVGYRYYDTVGKKAMFPFGFGLSYTTFERSLKGVMAEGEHITVKASVKNTGAIAGKEVLQLYVSVPEDRLDQPYQTLAGWAKTTEIAPGESAEVSITFAMSDLASYDTERAAYVLEQGDYILRLGSNSADTAVCGALHLEETHVVDQVKNCCGTVDFQDWKPENRKAAELPEGTTVLTISAADLPSVVTEYDREQEIDPAVEQLSDEELAYMNIGAFNPKGGVLSIIGNASTTVAGAAGESTGQMKEKGFPVMVMADGPAGLRLSQQYAVDDKGVHALGDTMPASIKELLPKPAAWIMGLMNRKPKADAQIRDQYATAIPIGTAIAQSWNLDLARDCGDIVGDEMERFGVHLWLAPALNIHRSIRCGRNFEYFSEDPLISGMFAAALTQGVQKHPGRGTTIKHYAANNQETNRYNNNSMVSERAMREIYLRGFGICVRESQPHALMTSYNLLNGEHTSERRDLTEDILRSEYGFRGIVMTDWIVAGGTMNKNSVHPAPKSDKIAAAGGDLVMPGSKGDYENILKALADGTLSRRQLQINATRVYRMAKKLS